MSADATARAIAKLIAQGDVRSAHDCSDGGVLVAAAEMAFAGGIGIDLDIQGLPTDGEVPVAAACFAETPSRYLLEVEPSKLDSVVALLRDSQLRFGQIGVWNDSDRLTLRTSEHGRILDVAIDDLRQAWLRPLDW